MHLDALLGPLRYGMREIETTLSVDFIILFLDLMTFSLRLTHSIYYLNACELYQRKIDAKLFEAEARLELAIHYKTPHPKPYNLTKQATPERIAEEPGRYLHSSHLVRCFVLQTALWKI